MAGNRIQIVLADDGLTAKLSVTAGDPMEQGAVAAALEAFGIVHGIEDRAVIEVENRIGEENFSIAGKLIARGTPPIPGADGKLELDFEPGPHPGLSRADGSLDLLNRGLLLRVSVGNTIAREVAPLEGKSGVRVTGEEIAALPGKEMGIQLGDGVEKSERGEIRAIRDGVIHLRPGTLLDVYDHYQHAGDVDIRSGHLETEGSISITGAVNANFEVRAGGDVEIKGGVFGGRVEAKGTLQVAAAITGGEDGYAHAGGDLRARHAQMARLESGGSITLATDCISTSVHARTLEVGRRLLGGETIVETLIIADEAGSKSGAGTTLRVGEPYESPHDKKCAEAASNKARRAIVKRRGSGPGVKFARAKGGKRSRQNLALEREQVKFQHARCKQRTELLEVAKIDIESVVNIGVEIRFGSRRLCLETTLGATRFQYDRENQQISTTRLEK